MTTHHRASFVMPLDLMWGHGTDWKALPVDAFWTVSAVCDSLLGDRYLRQRLRHQRYRVAVVDLIYNECSLALTHHLGIPSVGYWAFTFAGGEAQYTTAFSPPSSVPLIMTHYTDVMTFSQRLYNHLHALASHVVMQVQFLVTGYQILRHLPTCPWPNTLLSNLSGLLINSHPAIDYPRLLPPSFVNVGGLQIHTPKPLPKDLEEWLIGSGEAGTIVFSMGFIFQPTVVPKKVIYNLLDAFSRLPQRVLMKYTTSPTDPPPPPNVKMVPWLPQQDILSHPQTKLFFTHFGMHGVLESLYHGVPMVGMPVFADQRDVLVRLEQRGVARGVDKMADGSNIYEAIVDVLNNGSYRDNARRLSTILHHHPQKPLDHALWLIEHVADTQGAPHLKFSARHLNFFQFFGFDVLAFVAVGVFLLPRLLRVVCQLLRRLLQGVGSWVGRVSRPKMKKA
ncbi:hypothetical protein Pmani_015225 [Petrolisthes manimaculis]|uniref:Glucuronosyltransferase n=1 Tax=Petrolisthes manimaculis TaxID=1843537 RepID=A0AAE1UA49_9EUCA|nr:hypothetical protein Pmani_015225 [Petrolisthes manimaculis]